MHQPSSWGQTGSIDVLSPSTSPGKKTTRCYPRAPQSESWTQTSQTSSVHRDGGLEKQGATEMPPVEAAPLSLGMALSVGFVTEKETGPGPRSRDVREPEGDPPWACVRGLHAGPRSNDPCALAPRELRSQPACRAWEVGATGGNWAVRPLRGPRREVGESLIHGQEGGRRRGRFICSCTSESSGVP